MTHAYPVFSQERQMSDRTFECPVNYTLSGAPQRYRCDDCGAHGVKLWRDYQTFLNHQRLLCADCGVKDQKKAGRVDDNGNLDTYDGFATDQIGWLVPAVPTEEGDTFWGYTSVPQAGCDWWKRLPTRWEKTG